MPRFRSEVMALLAAAATYAPHLYHEVHDWMFMGAIVVALSIGPAIAAVRHRMWRRQVLSAFR